MPAAAAEAASKAVAAALRKGKPKQASDARSAGPADEQLMDELDHALGQGPTKDALQQAPGEDASEQGVLHSKLSDGSMLVQAVEQASREASEAGGKVKSSKPPPGFESVNGALKASSRTKKVSSHHNDHHILIFSSANARCRNRLFLQVHASS